MGDFLMNAKERERERILLEVKAGSINLKKAAELLDLSYPQAKRIWSNYKTHGPKGLTSKRRGKESNRAVSEKVKSRILKIITDELYDCKPLFVSEKLKELHNIDFSSEFVRQLMITHHLWIPKVRKKVLHQRRQRRPCEGELVQVDASDHDWFEGRLIRDGKPSKAHLHIYIDDATSTIYGGYFDYEETTNGYYKAAKPYFEKKGLPKELYVDKRGTFKVNSGLHQGETQFQRAMRELNIKITFAHSPQAKGRVERAFDTLQDRLVWEMRLLGISTLEEGNEFLPQYFEQQNKKFAKMPASSFDAHRQLDHTQNLKYILCQKVERTLSKNSEVQYDNSTYQFEVEKGTKRKVNVVTTLDGELQFELEGKFLKYERYEDLPYIENKTNTRKGVFRRKKSRSPTRYS